MCREIEASALLVRDVLDHRPLEAVTLHLGVSGTKTNIAGGGVPITLACLCKESFTLPCPCCDVGTQLGILKDPNSPLFPTSQGGAPSKEGMAETWRWAARQLGVPEMLALQVTGHAPRVAGAMFLAMMGIEEARIMSLARWGSAAIRGYTRRAHLWSVSNVTLQAAIGASQQRPAFVRAVGTALSTDWKTGGPLEPAPRLLRVPSDQHAALRPSVPGAHCHALDHLRFAKAREARAGM